MQTPNNLSLPPNWVVNEALKPFIPAPHDYRTFKFLSENENRYAACIVGGGIFNLRTMEFLKGELCGKKNRIRYTLSPGRGVKAVKRYYARIVCTLARGHPPTSKQEAHHRDDNPENNHWANLFWQTPKQNKELARESQAAMRRNGTSNGRVKLTDRALTLLVKHLDECNEVNVPYLAKYFRVSRRQIERIRAGDSRSDRVKEIRASIKAAKDAKAAISSTRTGNPFLDPLD